MGIYIYIKSDVYFRSSLLDFDSCADKNKKQDCESCELSISDKRL